MKQNNTVFKLSDQARSAISTVFLKCLAEGKDIQTMLEGLDLLILEGNSLGVMNPPESINMELLKQKVEETDEQLES